MKERIPEAVLSRQSGSWSQHIWQQIAAAVTNTLCLWWWWWSIRLESARMTEAKEITQNQAFETGRNRDQIFWSVWQRRMTITIWKMLVLSSGGDRSGNLRKKKHPWFRQNLSLSTSGLALSVSDLLGGEKNLGGKLLWCLWQFTGSLDVESSWRN